MDQTENLLGALALAVADRMSEAVDQAAGGPDSAAAALSALLHIVDRPSIDRLASVLGLTSSGTVRLVDRLAAAGYVERGSGDDRRATRVGLTEAGREMAARVTAARGGVLHQALAVLSPAERTSFRRLAGKLLVGLMREPGAARWTCRLCDTGTCGRYEGACPVGNEAQRRHGSPGQTEAAPEGAASLLSR